MASAKTATAVEVETRVAASPETVFDFLIDPGKLVQWMGRSAELDPRPGGVFRCDINGRDVASGEYVELDPPRRVVFSWGWEAEDSPTRPGSSTVEVLLAPDGDGTNLKLIHRDLPSPEIADKHRHGWEHYVERLATAAAGGDPGADPWATPEGADGSG
ncbi:MAG TPA: SRPBCC domain-containing protein [Solirubrobacterales bacterium]